MTSLGVLSSLMQFLYVPILLGAFLNDLSVTAVHLPQATLITAPAGIKESLQLRHHDSPKTSLRPAVAAKIGNGITAPQYLTIIEASREAIASMQAVVTKVRNFISALDPDTYASKNTTILSLVIGSFKFTFIFTEDTNRLMPRSLLKIPSKEELIKKALILVAKLLDRGFSALLNVAIFVYKAQVLMMVVFVLQLIGERIRHVELSHYSWHIII